MAPLLVLDDEPDAVVLMQRVLQRKGRDFTVFTEEDAAIDFARTCHTDLAIFDIKPKKMCRVKVLEELEKTNPAMHAHDAHRVSSSRYGQKGG